MEMMKKLPWDDKGTEVTQLYTAKFANPKKDFIIAGGADKHTAKIFSYDTGKVVSIFGGLNKACLVTDTTSEGNLSLIGCADGSIHVKNLIYA
jgi:WD40 repeat protein